MVNIRQNLVDSSKYSIKCPYQMTAEFIVVHNTANDASAENEIKYMISNNNKVSYHYAVDDKEIVQGIPEDRNAWHAGDGNGDGNRKGIAIEICYSKSGGEKFDKAEENAAEFIASKLKEKGWGIDKVKKHQDFANKYCPHRTLDYGWNRFLDKIKKYLNETNANNDNLKYFDVDLYHWLYKDLQKAFGGNEGALKQHYQQFGKKEGRIASYVFDPVFYINKYEDLKKAYGSNYEDAYNHFITFGIKEGRQTSIMFDPIYYLNKYEDLKKAYGNNYEGAFEHFIAFGMKEGRQASADFNVQVYKANYEDLQKAFGNNNKEYFKHYLIFGKKEGRKCV